MTRRNFLFGGGLLAAAVLTWALLSLFSLNEAATTVTVVDSEKVEHIYPLKKDGTYTITTAEGINVITIAEGEVRVESADCPNQFCVEHAPIHRTGETIVCLPHKLVVKLTNDGVSGRPLVDAIAG